MIQNHVETLRKKLLSITNELKEKDVITSVFASFVNTIDSERCVTNHGDVSKNNVCGKLESYQAVEYDEKFYKMIAGADQNYQKKLCTIYKKVGSIEEKSKQRYLFCIFLFFDAPPKKGFPGGKFALHFGSLKLSQVFGEIELSFLDNAADDIEIERGDALDIGNGLSQEVADGGEVSVDGGGDDLGSGGGADEGEVVSENSNFDDESGSLELRIARSFDSDEYDEMEGLENLLHLDSEDESTGVVVDKKVQENGDIFDQTHKLFISKMSEMVAFFAKEK